VCVKLAILLLVLLCLFVDFLLFFVFFASFCLCLLLFLRFLCFVISLCSPCSSVFASCPFVVFFVVFASFFRCFFVRSSMSSFVRFVASLSSDLMVRSSLEDGGLRHSTVLCCLHFDVRLPVVSFHLVLCRRLPFLRSLSSLIGDLPIVVEVASTGRFVRSRRVAKASSVRDSFRIHL